MKDLWDEMDALLPGKGCGCAESEPFFEHFYQQRLLQFLVGLNESYGHVRSQILMKAPVLTVNQAYALAIQEESQRALGVIDKLQRSIDYVCRKMEKHERKEAWFNL